MVRIIIKYLILVAVVSLLTFSASAQRVSAQQTPLPCTTEGRDPSKPWVHNAKVLASFPKDTPLPRYIGAFRDRNWDYQVILFRDSKGIFGELLSPVIEADSPTSRLYDARYNPRLGTLQFAAKFRNTQLLFNGVLRGRIIRGTATQDKFSEKVTLRRVKWYEGYEEVAYTSRAQFDCEMILYDRY